MSCDSSGNDCRFTYTINENVGVHIENYVMIHNWILDYIMFYSPKV